MNQPTLYDEQGLINLDQMVVCFTLHQAIIEHARYQEEGDEESEAIMQGMIDGLLSALTPIEE